MALRAPGTDSRDTGPMETRYIRFTSTNRAGGGSLRTGPGGTVAKVLAVVAGAMVLIAAVFVSAVVFSAMLVVGAVGGGWFWWKTRDVRKRFRERMAQAREAAARGPHREAADSSVVLDGDFIREATPEAETRGSR